MELLKQQYEEKLSLYTSFCSVIKEQIEFLLKEEFINIGFPIETRVKTWESIINKCEIKAIKFDVIDEINDLAGLRIITLFNADKVKIDKIIKTHFNVIKREDIEERLAENQFGYSSTHYEIMPKENWNTIPTLKRFIGLKAEVQLRSSSQHIWAATSHVLQYKKETDIPRPLRRTINRLAALLEIVDLEFDRIRKDRDHYIVESLSRIENLELNTESLKLLLDKILPITHKTQDENYSTLLDDLIYFKISDTEKLNHLIVKHYNKLLEMDKEAVKTIRDAEKKLKTSLDDARVGKEIGFTFCGFVRNALRLEFGAKAKNYFDEKYNVMKEMEELAKNIKNKINRSAS